MTKVITAYYMKSYFFKVNKYLNSDSIKILNNSKNEEYNSINVKLNGEVDTKDKSISIYNNLYFLKYSRFKIKIFEVKAKFLFLVLVWSFIFFYEINVFVFLTVKFEVRLREMTKLRIRVNIWVKAKTG